MGRLYEEELSEEEILDWWSDEIQGSTFVGSDNSGQRMQYVARPQEEIEKSMGYLIGRLLNQSEVE